MFSALTTPPVKSPDQLLPASALSVRVHLVGLFIAGQPSAIQLMIAARGNRTAARGPRPIFTGGGASPEFVQRHQVRWPTPAKLAACADVSNAGCKSVASLHSTVRVPVESSHPPVVQTVRELLLCLPEELLGIPKIGEKTVEKIYRTLERFGHCPGSDDLRGHGKRMPRLGNVGPGF